MATTRRPTGPYTPPTEPTKIPEEKPASVVVAVPPPAAAVPVRTAPVQAQQEDEPTDEPSPESSTNTGLMASDILVAGTQQMRMAAESRRARIAKRMESLREDWQQHQDTLTSLRKQGQAVVDEMNALAKDLDPILAEHERLVQAIHHFDATLETLGGAK